MKPYEPRLNWKQLARDMISSALFGTLLTQTFRALIAAVDEERERATIDADIAAEGSDDEDDEQIAARSATLLGISVDASEKEIRAALRTRLSASRLHPDHGGDADLTTRLIAARDVLIVRTRANKTSAEQIS